MKRIQRKRTKGWRMPPNAVYVGRPTQWGNPYRLVAVISGGAIGWEIHDEDGKALTTPIAKRETAVHMALSLFRSHLKHRSLLKRTFLRDLLEPLRGKDLCCWCKEDGPCHADILLDLLKQEAPNVA
jgi:hypothetical protein